MDFEKFNYLIENSEDILVKKVLDYAKKQDYAKYTSTLIEAWRQSIVGLSIGMINYMNKFHEIPELTPDEDYKKHEIALFGIQEAKKHQYRGITLTMFLGMMKYYQQSYLDLIEESGILPEQKQEFSLYVRRYFDFVELGFIMEWSGLSEEKKLKNLQVNNRKMTNEKNKYLTIFESIYDPIILIDHNNNIENVNSRAAKVFWGIDSSGGKYYGNIDTKLDWLKQELEYFLGLNQDEVLREKKIETKEGTKTFVVKMKRMLDFSSKYSGIVIIFYDITEQRKIEKQLKKQYKELEYYAYIDQMTDVFNRRTGLMKVEEEMALLGDKTSRLSLCYIDLDGLKLINDTYGHMAGDELIIFIISTLKKGVGDNGDISRLGGDEFLVILPNKSEKYVELIVKQVTSKLKEYDKKGIKPYKHEFSYGIVEISTDSKVNINDVIKRADQKMYEHKMRKKKKL